MTEDSQATNIVNSILARAAQEAGAKAAPAAPQGTAERIIATWAEAEIALLPHDKHAVASDHHHGREVVWCPNVSRRREGAEPPHEELFLAERPSGSRVYWREVPVGVLASHTDLLVTLKHAASVHAMKASAALLAASTASAVASARAEAAAKRDDVEYTSTLKPGAVQSVTGIAVGDEAVPPVGLADPRTRALNEPAQVPSAIVEDDGEPVETGAAFAAHPALIEAIEASGTADDTFEAASRLEEVLGGTVFPIAPSPIGPVLVDDVTHAVITAPPKRRGRPKKVAE